MADNSDALALARRRDSQAKRARAAETLRAMLDTGEAITFAGLARRAGVSVSLLYADKDLAAEVAEARDRQRQAGSDRAWRLPARSLVTEQSLRTDPGSYGGFLLCRDRYALQVTSTAASPPEALADVIARWSEAVRYLQLPAWELVRTEVFTPGELEREFEMADRAQIGFRVPERDRAPEEHDEIGRELLHRAFSDPPTGLLGRQAFANMLEAALRASRSRRALVVVCVDLDDALRLTPVLGGSPGDEVLVAVAQRLAAALRPRDLLARIGCHEYGVLLDESTENDAVAVARRMLGTIRLPVVVSGQEIILAAGAGVAMSRPGDTAEVVMANAEAALNAARATSASSTALFRSEA